ncbi:hypothetical protein BJX62DRAFT_242624 [Aspergillus germanicus]
MRITSQKGKPFRVWMTPFQDWVYVLSPKHLEKIKNEGSATLSFPEFVQKFHPGPAVAIVTQVAAKLVNTNLSEISPLAQARAEEFLDQQIGAPREWKKVNVHALAHDITKHISGRIVFGETLVHASTAIDPDLRVIARFIAEEIARREQQEQQEQQQQQQEEKEEERKVLDCIQWALEQDVPDDQKTPEMIAERLCYASAAMVCTSPDTVLNLVFDAAAAHGACVDEMQDEVATILAQDGNGWV